MDGKGGGNGSLVTHCGECLHTLAHFRLRDGEELDRENLEFFDLGKEGLEIKSLLEVFDDNDNDSLVEAGNDKFCTLWTMHFCSKFSIFSFNDPISCSFDFIIPLL